MTANLLQMYDQTKPVKIKEFADFVGRHLIYEYWCPDARECRAWVPHLKKTFRGITPQEVKEKAWLHIMAMEIMQESQQ